jgi:hypothetical protein
VTLLLLTLAALLLGYPAARVDHGRRRKPSEWWSGFAAGRDLGYRAGQLSRTEDAEP